MPKTRRPKQQQKTTQKIITYIKSTSLQEAPKDKLTPLEILQAAKDLGEFIRKKKA